MKQWGIERQAQLLALLPVLVIAALLESYFIYSRFDDLDQALLERSKLLAHQLAASSEYAVFSGDSGLLQQYLDSAMSFQDVRGIQILDASFNPIMKVGQIQPLFEGVTANLPQVHQDKHLLRLYEPIFATQIQLDDFERRSGPVKSLGMVVIEFSKARLESQKTEIIILNLLVTFIVLITSLAIALRVARKITLPILGMRRAIIDIGEGALHTRVSPKPNVRELHDLASGINKMAAQLQHDRSSLQEKIAQATVELRAKKDDAERANYSKTRFLAAASHDLRQPMHALGLFVGELLSIVITDKQRKIVMKVEESVEAMSGLLNSLLDISKLDAGIIVPQIHDFNIEQTLSRIKQDYQSVADSKSIKLRIISCSVEVISDPVLLDRILVNLVSNALRYTQIGGHVFVGCRKRGNNLRIEVRDNGIGIAHEDQKKVFHEFVQLANKERDRSMGLGLGLAIVERLSLLLEHPITLRSDSGKGALFTIDIPLANQACGISNKASQVGVINEPLAQWLQVSAKILVVDDDPLARSSTCGILSTWGYQVYLASSCAEVSNLFEHQTFDLAICDYRLPDGTGLDVINLINRLQRQIIPCILVSGDTSPDVLKEVTESGLSLLSKPVKPAKLRSLIQFLLSKSS